MASSSSPSLCWQWTRLKLIRKSAFNGLQGHSFATALALRVSAQYPVPVLSLGSSSNFQRASKISSKSAPKKVSSAQQHLRPAPLLFTPGPLTTSPTVKQAMLRDVGSRNDESFLDIMHSVRKTLVHAAEATQATHDCVIIQGAGTHGIESVLGSAIGPDDKVLILNNGAYGERQKIICQILGINYEAIDYTDDCAVSASDLEQRLACVDGGTFTHVSMVHHETTAGVINPLTEICKVLDGKDLELIVDSMSAFGAYEVDLISKHYPCKYLISSANKCMEGVPGFSYVIFEKRALQKLAYRKPKSLSLDLYAQAKGLTSGNGQFRFTPPTHSILAYHQALSEWQLEGGWRGRGGRYRQNYLVLKAGLEKMGLKFYVPESHRGFIITTVLSPTDANWDFQFFYNFLADRGYVIYPGKLSKAESFRLGTIGKIFPQDCENLLLVIEDAFRQMGITLPLHE